MVRGIFLFASVIGTALDDEGIVIPATHTRFITPTTKRTHISAQQHPRQYAPCSIPMRRAPAVPSRQWDMRNPSGLRQCAKHGLLKGVS